MSRYEKITPYIINAWQIGTDIIPRIFEADIKEYQRLLGVQSIKGDYVVFDGRDTYIAEREQFEHNYEKVNE